MKPKTKEKTHKQKNIQMNAMNFTRNDHMIGTSDVWERRVNGKKKTTINAKQKNCSRNIEVTGGGVVFVGDIIY